MSAEPSAGTAAAATSLSAMAQAPSASASASSSSTPTAVVPKVEEVPPLPASSPTTPKVRRSRKKAAYRSIFSPKCVNHCSETTKIKDLCKPCSNIQDAHRKKEGRKTPMDPNRPPSAKKAAAAAAGSAASTPGSAVLGKRPRPSIPPPAGYSPSPAASLVPTRFALTPVTISADASGLATDVVAEAKACRIWQLCKQYLDHHNVLSDMMPEMMAVMLSEIHECLRNHLNEIAIQKGLDAESSRMDEDADPASDHQDDTTSEPEAAVTPAPPPSSSTGSANSRANINNSGWNVVNSTTQAARGTPAPTASTPSSWPSRR